MITLTKATKILKPLKGCFYGPTASGKTYSSLQIANGIVKPLEIVQKKKLGNILY